MILGVTGGIASGKSTVSEALGRLGAAVVSADDLAREVVRPGSPVLERLKERFGREILLPEGALDRRALAGIVFADPRARADLNAIVHPAVAALALRRLTEAASSGAPLVVYEAPLLFEAGAQERVDAVLVVTVDEPVQIKRLMARDGFTEEEARSRIAAQIPQAEKAARADYVIDNSGSPEGTLERVRELFRELTGVSGGDPPGPGGSRG